MQTTMFGPTLAREITSRERERLAMSLPDPGEWHDWRERQLAMRESAGPDFQLVETGAQFWEAHLRCPCCANEGPSVESESFSDYGGCQSGYERCGYCGYSKSWTDLSAVI